MKNRRERLNEYDMKYAHIPRDLEERLGWMYDTYHITPQKAEEILYRREDMVKSLYYKTFTVVLYEEPIGSARPRTRLINKKNLVNVAKIDSSFIHIYSPHAKENHTYMRRIIDDMELEELQQLICTPCDVVYRTFDPTPAAFPITDKFMCEIGLIRPLKKPDWDNIGKCYSDMYNENVWLDDVLTVDGRVSKYWSVLPRVEIQLSFLNMVYNKYQYNSITHRRDFDPEIMQLEYYKYGGNN